MSFSEWLENHKDYKSYGWANSWDKEREAEAAKAIGNASLNYVRLYSETLAVCHEKKLYYHMTSGG